MEAKRRRSEKQRSLRSEREGGSGNLSLSLEEKKEIEMNLRARLDREKSLTGLKRSGSSLASQLGLSSWAARSGADAAALGKGKGSYGGSGGGGSQGSVESKGGSSSSISDLETKNSQGK